MRSLEEMFSTEAVGATRGFTAGDRAWTSAFGAMLPVLKKRLSPPDILRTFVRRGKVLVHEGDNDIH